MTKDFKYPIPKQPFIHGKFVDAKGLERVSLYSATDDSLVLDDFQYANSEDVDLAVESAEQALKVWQSYSAPKKSGILLKFADLLQENAEYLGYLDTIVSGKAAVFTKDMEAKFASDLFRYYAGFTDKIEGDSHPTDDGFLKITRHEPLGICAAINAFNGPIITFAMKAAPALASGNVMITKASELNPISSLALGDIALQAGFPPGALNILVGGPDTGVALSTHMKIRKISFTGSIVVGQKIQAAAALSNLKRVTLELGGKSPVLVFADADLPNAIQNSAVFLTLNGQGCAFGTRIYVHESVADAYIEGLKGVIAAYTANLGSDPYDRTTWSCPLFNSRQKATVARFIEQGKTEAELLVGGEFVGDKGNYVQPTLFYKPKPGAQILKHEIFGPIAVIDTFKTEAEVLEKANDSDYGLAAELFTKDLSRAIRVSAALEAGTVVVNTCQFLLPTMPFGGHKMSGIGRENGKYAIQEYMQTKSIIIKFEGEETPSVV